MSWHAVASIKKLQVKEQSMLRLYFLTAFIFGLLIAPAQANEQVQKRVALVIGNSNYKDSPLKNPVNDARDVATKLRSLGFDVIERNNLLSKQIGRTLSEFRSKLTPGDIALVFYAGHGLQIKGENYLPAVDADISTEEDVPNQSLSVKQIMDVLDESKTRLNLVFLDACRNNPYSRSFRSAAGGLAKVETPGGTLISYATRPGSVAADGQGNNGLYTSKLLQQMDSQLQIELALKQIVSDVKAASQGQQEPWMEGSIEGNFCFAGCSSDGTQVVKLKPAPVQIETRIKTKDEIEQESWEIAQSSKNMDSLKEFLKQYPKGKFAGQARILITNLKKVPPQATPAAQTVEPSSSSGAADNEGSLWAEVQKGNSVDDYDVYLAQYPKGKYATLAKSRIRKQQQEGTKVATSGIEMIAIPGKDYEIGKYVVTQKQWKEIMGYNPSNFSPNRFPACDENCPVENVNWNMVQEFIQKLNAKTGNKYRLPKEEEWKHACDGGAAHEYCGGDTVDSVAWYDNGGGSSVVMPHPVGQKQANAYGLYDMSGNVWEIMEDKFDNKHDWRVLRGGSWLEGPESMRAKARIPFSTLGGHVGFRLAKDKKRL